ncbi:MAG: sulfite exporter TauE/SafE family protein [Deltaproteobacteria bacterium]|nr:MAG: sulfite exporter TauE/SafE family protein [Deltaproteobacteria bacterium]
MIDGALATTAFVAALAGSLHCAGMCGPIVGLAAIHPGPSARGRAAVWKGTWGHAAGRLAIYAAYGAAAGLLGGGVDRLAAASGAAGVAARLSGLGLVVAGLFGIVGRMGPRLAAASPTFRSLERLRHGLAGRAAAVAARRPLGAGMGLGLLSGLLPCGFLWAFVLVAAGTGSVAGGVAVMSAFWLGTVPVLGVVGLGAGAFSPRLRGRMAAVLPVVLIAVGTFVLLGRTSAHGAKAASSGAAAAAAPCHGHGG